MNRSHLSLWTLATAAACQWIAPLPEERYRDQPGVGGEPSIAGDGGESGQGAAHGLNDGGGGAGDAAGGTSPNDSGGASVGAGLGGELTRLPGSPASTLPVAVVSRAREPDGTPVPELDLIWTTGEGVHHLSRQDGEFGTRADLGGAPTLPPVVLATVRGQLDIFIAEGNGDVRHRPLQDDGWNELGGQAERGLSGTGDRERMDLFAVDSSGMVTHRSWLRSSGWAAAWTELTGALAGYRVAVASPRKDRVEAFLSDNGTLLTQVFQELKGGGGGWNGHWSTIPVCTAGPSSSCPCAERVVDHQVVATNADRVDLVFESGSLFHLWRSAAVGWQCEPLHLPVTASSRPALLSRELGRMDLLIPGDDALALRSWSGEGWSAWSALALELQDLAMASPYPDSLFVFGRTPGDEIEYLEWSSSTGWMH